MDKVINLVNFVRGCEPRAPRDLFTPVAEEIRTDKAYGFRHTFLLQYDALERQDFADLFRRERDENMELGVWFEMCRSLTEKVGIPWRGRPGYDWDWYVNPGFLPAYTPAQREALIDEVFRLFKEIFGHYPRCAGSWLLDAHSMAYMSDRYGMDAFCICREQYAIDAYTLWGGYYSGGYYPSRNNPLCPAQSEETQINTPVFRMLGIDPIYGYDGEKHSPRLTGCYTMEPFWPCGKSDEVMDWYYEAYYKNETLSMSQATTGQENSFSWPGIEKGYRLQARKIAELEKQGVLQVQTLRETGEAFRQAYRTSPPAAFCALRDWSDNGIQSIWYSSINWRGNLFLKDGKLLFRDIRKYDDRCPERYLTQPCEAWQATYDNLPVVDNRLWSLDGQEAALTFSRPALRIREATKDADGRLIITVDLADDGVGTLIFSEEGFTARDCGDATLTLANANVQVEQSAAGLTYVREGFRYTVGITPAPEKDRDGYRVDGTSPIRFCLNHRDSEPAAR